jgi:hypothetical protein
MSSDNNNCADKEIPVTSAVFELLVTMLCIVQNELCFGRPPGNLILRFTKLSTRRLRGRSR